jgi:hypothetical protein
VLTLEISFLCQTDQLVSYSSSRTARISLLLVSAGGNFSRQDMKLLKRGQGIMGCYLFSSIICVAFFIIHFIYRTCAILGAKYFVFVSSRSVKIRASSAFSVCILFEESVFIFQFLNDKMHCQTQHNCEF